MRSRGRVASLIEVRSGIHPELTGRENVFLYGSILGLSRKDIRKRFEAIGWVERAAGAPAVPEFRLAKGGIASFVLTCPSGRYDLVAFLGKEVGIKGKVLENEGRVPRMLVVERLEILSN